jgi:hypothetical protein
MQVRFNATTLIGAKRFRAGQISEFSERIANVLIQSGSAEPVDRMRTPDERRMTDMDGHIIRAFGVGAHPVDPRTYQRR